jgi:hypothetical protein
VQSAGKMPSSLIDKKHSLRARRDLCGDFGEMQGHRLGVAARHDEGRALALFRADRAENIGRSGSLVVRGAGARAAPGPTARDLVLPADARLVGEPDFYRARIDALLAPDLFQARGKAFLKSSIAPSACA